MEDVQASSEPKCRRSKTVGKYYLANLLFFLAEIRKFLDEGHWVDVCYTNLSGDFDSAKFTPYDHNMKSL